MNGPASRTPEPPGGSRTPVRLSEDEMQKLAKARVGFRTHAMVYVIVNLFLAAVWLVTSRLASPAEAIPYWPIWPHLAWGIGLALHGFVVYGAASDWQRKEASRLRRKHT